MPAQCKLIGPLHHGREPTHPHVLLWTTIAAVMRTDLTERRCRTHHALIICSRPYREKYSWRSPSLSSKCKHDTVLALSVSLGYRPAPRGLRSLALKRIEGCEHEVTSFMKSPTDHLLSFTRLYHVANGCTGHLDGCNQA